MLHARGTRFVLVRERAMLPACTFSHTVLMAVHMFATEPGGVPPAQSAGAVREPFDPPTAAEQPHVARAVDERQPRGVLAWPHAAIK